MLHDSAQAYRRSLAVKWVEDGINQTENARRLEVTQGAVSQWVARAREGGRRRSQDTATLGSATASSY